jgi:hypothetical protein
VERQAHLEASVELDGDDALYHKVIARWLKYFLSVTKESIIEASKVKQNGSGDDEGENPYMEVSSGVDLEV